MAGAASGAAQPLCVRGRRSYPRDMDAVTRVPAPRNEPERTYAPGSPERAALQARLAELAGAAARADR